jgi:predicted enzyme related to lactoylglutathione lyase
MPAGKKIGDKQLGAYDNLVFQAQREPARSKRTKGVRRTEICFLLVLNLTRFSLTEKLMINGIGGAFLFSNDVKRLAAWYRDCLGIVAAGEDGECKSVYATFDYRDIENPEMKRTIAWAIMATDQDIRNKPRTGKINYTVQNMAETLSHLKSKGVVIEKTEEYPGMGTFAWLKDPDGNAIELWQPSNE